MTKEELKKEAEDFLKKSLKVDVDSATKILNVIKGIDK